jgi:hypothetical protein
VGIDFELPNSIGLNKFNPNQISRTIVNLEQSFEDPSILFLTSDYTGTDTKESSLFYVSFDEGKTWQKKRNEANLMCEKFAIAVSKAEKKAIWLNFSYKNAGKTHNKVKKSIDNGLTWIDLFDGFISGTNIYRQEIKISPINSNIIYLAGYYVNRSIDGGKTFQESRRNLHVDCRKNVGS